MKLVSDGTPTVENPAIVSIEIGTLIRKSASQSAAKQFSYLRSWNILETNPIRMNSSLTLLDSFPIELIVFRFK